MALFYFSCLVVFLAMTDFHLRLSHLILLMFPLAFLESNPRFFLINWFPFAAVIFIYDSFRGIADELGAKVNYIFLPTVEKLLFGGYIPSVELQRLFYKLLHGWPGHVLAVFYCGHFILPVLFLYILWKRDVHSFRLLCLSLAIVSLLGFCTFALFPTAPPWMTAQKGYLGPVKHLILYHLNLVAITLPDVYVQMNPNPVAAFPSLHTAYPFILYLIASRSFPIFKLLLGLNFLLVCFTIVAFGEHYVVDLIAGIGYGIIAFILSISLNKRLSRKN